MRTTAAQRGDMPGLVPAWVVGTAVAGTIVIAVGAFWLSFTALADLAEQAGIPTRQAWVWPLIVDGLIVVATVSVVALSPYGRKATCYPWTLLTAGAIVSVGANALHALIAADHTVPTLLAAAVSAVPPLVLLAITHLTVELTRKATASPSSAAAVAKTDSEDGLMVISGEQTTLDGLSRRRAAQVQHEAGWTNKRIAQHLGVHPSTVGRWFNAAPSGSGHTPR